MAGSRMTPQRNGVGVVVLKRLSDALADGDPIRAVILGTAINNDGSGKTGFTAPSVNGQIAVITEAQAMAGVEYNFSPLLGVTLDARYLHGRGDLGTAFTGYDRIDLSGASASVGLSIRL